MTVIVYHNGSYINSVWAGHSTCRINY